MKRVICESLEQAKKKLQVYINKQGYSRTLKDKLYKRKWLKATSKDSYSDSKYRVEMWVLEGSPVWD